MKTLLTIILTVLICTSITNASPLQDIWNKRPDLQTAFPDGYHGVGWTLSDWAFRYGWEDHAELMGGGSEAEKNYIHQKYLPLEKALREISEREYTEDYQCNEFSDDLRKELDDIGIQTLKVNGMANGGGHWWVAVQFEPITGDFVVGDYEVRRVDASEKFIKIIR